MALVLFSLVSAFILSTLLSALAVLRKRPYLFIYAYLIIGWAGWAIPIKILIPAVSVLGMLFITLTWPAWCISVLIPDTPLRELLSPTIFPLFFDLPEAL